MFNPNLCLKFHTQVGTGRYYLLINEITFLVVRKEYVYSHLFLIFNLVIQYIILWAENTFCYMKQYVLLYLNNFLLFQITKIENNDETNIMVYASYISILKNE